MYKKKFLEKRLSYLKLAREAQQIAAPYQKQGISLSEIYLNHVVKEVPVCMNIFRKMMNEDVSNYLELVKDYALKSREYYLKRLERQREKRIK